MKILKNKIILSVWIFSLLILAILYYFIPYITEKNIDAMIINNSKRMVQQVKLTRTYYLDNVVSKIKNKKSLFIFVANHKDDSYSLPLPSTLIHDLGDVFANETGVGFRTYSHFPFKNRQYRVLSSHDEEVLKNITQTKDGIYISKTNIDGEPMLSIAVADYMEKACVNCHNQHPDKTWSEDKWKVGDIRGVIEISTPLSQPISRIHDIEEKILWFMAVLFSLLIVYYSLIFLWREDRLLERNELLDKRVANEIEKNNEKEQILIQKSKLSSMGEMLNNIAHQWRQPLSELSTLLMNIDIRYQNNKLDKTFMDSKMKKSEVLLEYMSHTIDDFKNFFQMEKDKKYFKLKTVIDSVCNISNIQYIEDITIIINVKEDIEIFGYQSELSQVILNVISNAKDALFQHQIKNAFIKISASKTSKNVYIKIEDNARGIKEDELDKIFDLYYTEKEEGSGIGLYMSKLIIEKHFLGSISVQNVKYGALFCIEIPINDLINQD